MNTLDYTIMLTYLIGLLLIGFVWRKQNSKQDFFLGGRSLGWKPLSLSIMATQLSAISFISAPAFVGLREGGGLIWLSYEIALPLAMLLLLWLVLPTLHRSGVISVYDYLERRFDKNSRFLLSLVFQISRSFATAIMIYAVSIILQSTIGLAFWQSVLLIGGITLVYSLQGGMKAVVIGDAVQMILIIFGAVTCLFYGLHHIGGWDQFMLLVDPNRLQAINFSSHGFDGESFGFLPMLFGGIVLYASYYGCDQSEAQRSLSAKNPQDLKRMIMTASLLRFPITLIYCAAGLVIGTFALNTPELLAQIPDKNPDWMMPVFIVNYLPNGIIGLLLVAIMAAAMSSLSSAINSLSAVSVEDFCRLAGKQPDSAQYVSYARYAGIFWGMVTLLLSFYAGSIAPTVIEAINKIGSVFYGPVLAVFILAITTKSVTAKQVNIGLVVGVCVNLYLWLSGSTIFWFWWNLIGFLSCLLTVAVLSKILSPITNDTVNTKQAIAPSPMTKLDYCILLSWFVCIVIGCYYLPLWISP
jgi:SSS family transporter